MTVEQVGTRFVGRDRELADLAELLDQSAAGRAGSCLWVASLGSARVVWPMNSPTVRGSGVFSCSGAGTGIGRSAAVLAMGAGTALLLSVRCTG